MPTKIYWIESFPNGSKLGIMPRPRGNEWLDDEILHLKKQKVTDLVSLLESTEIRELELGNEAAKCSEYGIEFINFPIADRHIPPPGDKIETFIKSLSQKMDESVSIVIHCRMGIGRSSIIAGAILLLKGYKANNIITQITAARGLKVPDTEAQLSWLRKIEFN